MRIKLPTLLASLAMINVASAATPIDLRHQHTAYLQRYLSSIQGFTKDKTGLKETSVSIDQNQTAHTRVQQMFAGYPVWDATAVIHTPNVKQKKYTIMAG